MLWLCIRLPTLPRESGAASERAALERLAAWAYQWSSWVSLEAQAGASRLWLELAASRALFGEPVALLRRIEQALSRLGYSHHCALAPSPTAAALLTVAPARARIALSREQLRERLVELPLSLLEVSPEILAGLQAAGLRRIGELLALPSAALARRFGPECSRYLARLTGAASDPRAAFRPPESYRARWQFDQELSDTTALLFPLQRLLQEFQGYLRGRDRAVQRFVLELEHASDPARPRCTQLTMGLSTPERQAQRFLSLARERLQALTLPAPVRSLTLSAEQFTAPWILQADLFGNEAQRLGSLSPLLDRLRARLGSESVQSLACRADHRPERAFQIRVLESAPLPPAPTEPVRQARPCALSPHPLSIEAPTRLLSGPERIESGWWDGRDIRRDYYVARAADGARWWVYRDLTDGRWYLQGWWL
jgi:protein ImuB